MIIINKKFQEKSYFIHIPRTGGRYIKSRLEKNGYELKYSYYNERYMGIDIPHLHYPLYKQFLISQQQTNQLKYWTVVRNPYDRFFSTINAFSFIHTSYYSIFSQIESYSDFVKVIRSIRSHRNLGDSSNWLRQQMDFIHPDHPRFFWWKYEDGFGEEFVQWVDKNLNLELIDINKNDYSHTDFDNHDKSWMNDFSDRIKPWIYQYYDVDFEFFGYEG